MKYKIFWQSERYTTGIYPGCDAAIYMRSDGLAARVEVDEVKWRGNTGGYHRRKTYYRGRVEVKSMVRRLRLGQKYALGDGLSRKSVFCLGAGDV